MSRGYAWLDTGTHESLTEATEFVKAVEKRTGLKIACIEEVAYRIGFIDKEQFKSHADNLGKSGYANYLRKTLK
jgi:glucose-1-phosphate thymidylyltransferase